MRAFTVCGVLDEFRYIIISIELIFRDIKYFLVTIVIIVFVYFFMLLGVNRIYDRESNVFYHIHVAMKLGVGEQTFDDYF